MSEQRPTSESEAIELIRSIDVRAPESLHDAVEQMIAERPARREREYSLQPRLATLGALAAAVVALAVVIGNSGSSPTLSVRDASALTLRAATFGAPAESSSNHTELVASVDGVAFPYWGAHFGWRQTGTRTDAVDGHTVTTVFYENSLGHRVGYAIVARSAPSQITGGVVARRDGTAYRLLTVDGTPVVAWIRAGHLCVISGRGVDGATLLRLASWSEHGAQTS
ncbi:MAG TPA: hypothetical protein VK707_06955 [Solirubrobacteraceae bacterium]|jgi:hypothetical protein|nr:hypothetical protein [Solirubrobacteraceae bacterium]